jgi:hypothetical protein
MKNIKVVFNLDLFQVHTLLVLERDQWVVKHQLSFGCGCRKSYHPNTMHDVNYWCKLHWPTHVEVTK